MSEQVEVRVIAVGVLWTAGALLLGWATFGGPHVVAEWAVFMGTIATAWTVTIALSKARNRVSAGVARELAMHRGLMAGDDDVVPLR